MEITITPVTPATWPLLEGLFAGRGGPGHCWCMAWRPMVHRAQSRPQDRKAALRAQVDAGVPTGLVLLADGAASGWVSLGPKASFRRLTPGPAEPGLWSLTCFFIRRELRGQGLSALLLQAAIAEARSGGAVGLQAYPVDPDSPSYRFMGFPALFAAQGFGPVGLAGSRRQVWQLDLAV